MTDESLVAERDRWRQEFRTGIYKRPWALHLYDRNRQSELWRASRLMEYLCEYTLHLEELLGKAINKENTDEQ